jgi:hypothetical protein
MSLTSEWVFRFQNGEMEFLYLLVAAVSQYLDYGKSKNSYMIGRTI